MLDDAVLRPLQHFKLELGRRLTAAEVAQIKVHLKRDLQNDILLKVTDGEDLIMLLDQYFGVDNIRLLERLLSLIECYDLLNALLDWKETDYPAKPEVFYGKLVSVCLLSSFSIKRLFSFSHCSKPLPHRIITASRVHCVPCCSFW